MGHDKIRSTIHPNLSTAEAAVAGSDSRARILVTGTGGRSVGSGILYSLTASCSTVASRWHMIAGDADPFSWGLYKAESGVLLPKACDPKYIDAVRSVVLNAQVQAVIPGTEAEIAPLVENQHLLKPAVIIANRLELLPLMLDKFLAARLLNELAYPSIPTLPVDEWREVARDFGYPLILKPTKGTGGSRGVLIVMSEEELRRALDRLDPSTAPCIQPYIGDADHEYTVGVLTDRAGQLIDSIVMRRKLIGLSLLDSRQHDSKRVEISTGYSQGFIVRDKEIQTFCERLARDLDSRGPLNIQLRRDTSSGLMYVFEIHPRFSGTTPIRSDVGFNEVDVILRNYLYGEEFGRLEYQSNVAAIRALQHVVVPVEKMQSLRANTYREESKP